MAAQYDLKNASSGQFHFNLKAGNGEVILTSEQYTTKAAAENGIESVRKHSAEDACFDRREAKDGRAYFVLTAGGGEIIGQSQMYASEKSRDNGIESVNKNGADAEVRDNTE